MEAIKGLEIEKLPFTPQKRGDLLYHDGPLLSHFVDAERPDVHYFYRWVDNNNEVNRWLIVKATEQDILEFLEEKISLYDLMNYNSVVTILDLDKELNPQKIQITTTQHLPASYLPPTSSTFNASFFEEYAKVFKRQLLQKQQEQVTTQALYQKVTKMEQQQHSIVTMLNEFVANINAGVHLKPSK